jgi:succinyl-CoA synthetase beta subunit
MMANVSKNKPFVDIVVKAQVHAGGRGKGFFK